MKDQKDQIPQKHAQKGKSGELSSGKSASSKVRVPKGKDLNLQIREEEINPTNHYQLK